MIRKLHIDALWDDEAKVWLATSADVARLCVEAETWAGMMEEVRLILPDLMALNDQSADRFALTFRAESHLDVARAS